MSCGDVGGQLVKEATVPKALRIRAGGCVHHLAVRSVSEFVSWKGPGSSGSTLGLMGEESPPHPPAGWPLSLNQAR